MTTRTQLWMEDFCLRYKDIGLRLLVVWAYAMVRGDVAMWLKMRNSGAVFNVLALFLMGLPFMLFAIYYLSWTGLGFMRIKRWNYLVIGGVIGCLATLPYAQQYYPLITMKSIIISWDAIALILFHSFIIAALQEEILFRGLLQPKFIQYTNPLLGVFLTAVLYAIAHIGYFSYSYNLTEMLISAFFIGMASGILYFKTKSLYASIGFRGTLNAIPLMIAAIQGSWATILPV